MSNTKEKLLVTGASGHLGRLVLKALIKNKAANIIATSRNIEKISEFAKDGVEIRPADFNDQKSLVTAFRGADRLLLISTDAIGARIEQHKNAISAAKEAGVKHIIYTSWPKAETSKALVSEDHLQTEKLIKESGLTYTILRNFNYAENIFHSIPTAIQMGVLYGTAGAGKVAYVTREDCANAAAGALLSDKHQNKILDVTGPKAYNYEELVGLVSEVTGKNLKYVNLPEAEFKAALLKSGLPEIWADVFVTFDIAFRNGDTERPSNTVFELSGIAPKDFKDFLFENKVALLAPQTH